MSEFGINPWWGISLVLTILGGLIGVLAVFKRQYNPHPELLRKLLHVGMGLVTLTFPWAFRENWPVFLLATLSILFLLALKFVKVLHKAGDVVNSVSRRSLGEIYFPLSVALLYLLSGANWVLFCIPMLILTLADAVAALIGVRYGLMLYTTGEGQKSAEGSVAFFTVAFMSTHVPLLLLTDTGRAETLLVALIIGLVVMLIEAIAWRGLDNLFIPLGSFFLLKLYLTLSVPQLTARLIAVAILVAFVLIWRRRTTLNDSALLGVALAGYASCFLVSWYWLLPPLILFIAYSLFCPWTERNDQETHDIRAVISVISTGLLWLVLGRIFHQPEFFYPYNIAFAAHLAIIDIAIPRDYPQMPAPSFVSAAILKGWLLLFAPFVALKGWDQAVLVDALVALPVIAIAALGFYGAQLILHKRPNDLPLWASRAFVVTATSALGLVPLYFI